MRQSCYFSRSIKTGLQSNDSIVSFFPKTFCPHLLLGSRPSLHRCWLSSSHLSLASQRTATSVPDAIISSKMPLLLGKQELTSSQKPSWTFPFSLSLDRAVHLCNFNPQNVKLLSFPTRVYFEIKEDYNRCRSRCLEGNRGPKIQDGQPIYSSSPL